MAKPSNSNHRKRYEKYKSQDRYGRNKDLKHKRDEKRRAKFEKRRNDPEYQAARKARHDARVADPNYENEKWRDPGAWNKPNGFKRVMDKLEYEMDKEERIAKRDAAKNYRTKKGSD